MLCQLTNGKPEFSIIHVNISTLLMLFLLLQAALLSILSSVPYTQVLVFSNYSTIAQATADYLNSRGFPAVYMSSNQDQARRMAVMQTFRQFNCR